MRDAVDFAPVVWEARQAYTEIRERLGGSPPLNRSLAETLRDAAQAVLDRKREDGTLESEWKAYAQIKPDGRIYVGAFQKALPPPPDDEGVTAMGEVFWNRDANHLKDMI